MESTRELLGKYGDLYKEVHTLMALVNENNDLKKFFPNKVKTPQQMVGRVREVIVRMLDLEEGGGVSEESADYERNLLEEYEELERELEFLKKSNKELADKNARFNGIEEKYKKVTGERDTIVKQAKKIHQEKSGLEQEVASLKRSIGELRDKLFEIEQEKRDINAQLETLISLQEEAVSSNERLEEENSALKRENDKMRGEFRGIREGLEERIHEAERNSENVATRNNVLSRERVDLQSNLASAKQELSETREELARLQGIIQVQKQENGELKSHLEVARQGSANPRRAMETSLAQETDEETEELSVSDLEVEEGGGGKKPKGSKPQRRIADFGKNFMRTVEKGMKAKR